MAVEYLSQFDFIALKKTKKTKTKANRFTAKTTFTNHERHLVHIKEGYQPNANGTQQPG